MPWPVHPTGLLGAQGDNDAYRIERSLRFNSADLAYLSRTFAGAGTSKTTATLSLWVKRAKISGSNYADAFYESHTTNYNIFGFSGSVLSDTLYFTFRNGGSYYSNNVYRDTSAWYHILINYDSTNATQADRFRFYVNGVRGTFNPSYTPAFALNYEFEGDLGVAGAKLIGSYYALSGYEPNFYLAEYHFVDGQALSASSFTETDPTTGRLKAKAYSGAYGNHGFYLKFADNSGATATTLGKDSSPNGNNWTPNNFSVTAGTGNDSLVDSPTNYGSDTGVGGEVRGNYATWNPIEAGGNGTFSDGNLLATAANSSGNPVRSTISFPITGKWYCEITGVSVGANATGVGIISNTSKSRDSGTYYYQANGQKAISGSASSYGSSWTNNDIIGIALDEDAGTLVMYKNNVSQGTLASGITGQYDLSIAGGGGSTIQCYANFGQRPFAYTAPTGFKALCTTNLSTPTIKKPSSYFDALAYTGTGASNSISSLGFSPDLVWIKNRGAATSHAIYDTTRGTQSQLSSDTTGDQVTSSSGLTAFGSNGFTISTSTLVNTSGTQYVSWAWDEAPIAGMDIVSYTGNGANRTISHNLGVAPKMIIVKARTTAGADQGWPVWHTSIANTTYLGLNSTSATATGADYWNSTSPTSSVFSLGANAAVNANNDTYISYLFSEIEGYSKFGSYTGNGSADGPFVWCGFRPKWVMIKNSSSAYAWIVYDTARSTENLVTLKLAPNNSQEENGSSIGGITFNTMDILSNGFKLRSTNVDSNASGNTIIFAAFAESPFKYARAR